MPPSKINAPPRRVKNLLGRNFGYLVVIEFAYFNKWRNACWKCECRCGKIIFVRSGGLCSGHTKSCGCLRQETTRKRSYKHGHRIGGAVSAEYHSWHSMKQRCENENREKYRRYGARGISVCRRWRNSFENFLKDMGKRPGSGYSLDRIDNNGNYEPGNCRWATAKQQARNKRK